MCSSNESSHNYTYMGMWVAREKVVEIYLRNGELRRPAHYPLKAHLQHGIYASASAAVLRARRHRKDLTLTFRPLSLLGVSSRQNHPLFRDPEGILQRQEAASI
jgi:hypothetical protein